MNDVNASESASDGMLSLSSMPLLELEGITPSVRNSVGLIGTHAQPASATAFVAVQLLASSIDTNPLRVVPLKIMDKSSVEFTADTIGAAAESDDNVPFLSFHMATVTVELIVPFCASPKDTGFPLEISVSPLSNIWKYGSAI